jgi:hypothetical protein
VVVVTRAALVEAPGMSVTDHDRLEAVRQGRAETLLPRPGDGGIALAPTTPGRAPFRLAAPETLDRGRRAILQRPAPGGLLGLAEVRLPALGEGNAPVGLSLRPPCGTKRGLPPIPARPARSEEGIIRRFSPWTCS